MSSDEEIEILVNRTPLELNECGVIVGALKREKEKHLFKPWTLRHQQKYNSLYNYLVNVKNLEYNINNFINGHEDEIYEIIDENASWKLNTKLSYFSMLARYCFNNNNNYYSLFLGYTPP